MLQIGVGWAGVDTLIRVKRLIVNADDFGLTSGVNRAILELHEQGVLTSTTLMANAAATAEAVEIALATSTLGVGCHVVLVDGEPVLPVSEIPALVEPETGRFFPTLGKFLKHIYGSVGRRAAIATAIEAEAFAQLSRLKSKGVRLTHLDTHKHTHMFRPVLEPVLRAAVRAGVERIRNPFEPQWAVAATPGAPAVRGLQVRVLRSFESGFRRRVAAAGLRTTDGAPGVLATGTLDAGTVSSLLAALPDGVWELVTHPGYNDADLGRARTRLLAQREVEMQALGALAGAPGVELISFAEI